MKVLGVSGSPVPNSNTDRALNAVLDATGLDTDFVKLTDYALAPCLACLGCAKSNECVIDDDGNLLAEKAKNADALVVAGFTPYSTLDARTKAFLERLYPLRHMHGYMAGKVGAAVITSCVPEGDELLPPAAQMGVNAIQFYMMEEGMQFVGALKLQGVLPCLRCGEGDVCQMTGVKMIHGHHATVDTVGVKCFEQQPMVIDGAQQLGQRIANALASQKQNGSSVAEA